MIRIHLDDASHEQLRALRRKPFAAKVRDRIEMLILADAGWSAPQIASHLGSCGQTVRDTLKDFLDRGTQAIHPQRPGPAPDLGRCNEVAHELKRFLAEDRTWTSRQLSEALAARGIKLGLRQVRRHLKRMNAGDRRTASTLQHKQNPAKVERAGKVLANLKTKAKAGLVMLDYLDECGFSPTLPVTSSGSFGSSVLRRPVRRVAPRDRRGGRG